MCSSRGLRVALLVAALAATSAGCTLSHPLDEAARAAPVAIDSVEWRPATRTDVVGYFESERVTGEAAVSVRRLYYQFNADGTYSGAALLQASGGRSFQTLSGRWALDGGSLRLGEDAPAKALAGSDRLRLDSSGGAVVLRRAKDE